MRKKPIIYCRGIQSTNVIKVYDVVKSEKGPVLVLVSSYNVETIRSYFLLQEDIGGVSLKDYFIRYAFVIHIISNSTFRKQKQLTIEEFLQLAVKITRAVGDLHNEKVIHFDVKPGNVIYNPSTKVLKLTDLNHAAPVGCTATIFRGTAGSKSTVVIRMT